MVAAWISADTGVGPAIASPSHACSGSCALLPVAASSSRRPSASSTPELASSAPAKTPENAVVPKVATMSMIASDIPMSPTRFMTKAFLAAVAYSALAFQKPMSRYDARPTPSHPTYTST